MTLIKVNRLKFQRQAYFEATSEIHFAGTDKDQDSGSYGGICSPKSHNIEVDRYYGLHSGIPFSHYTASSSFIYGWPRGIRHSTA